MLIRERYVHAVPLEQRNDFAQASHLHSTLQDYRFDMTDAVHCNCDAMCPV